jgi:hypothetical protein
VATLQEDLFVGHFAIAFVLIFLFPQVPIWVPLVGVSFPDLLWSVLVFAGKEEVVPDKNNPLQKAVQFRKFPYSHSFVLTNVISSAIGAILSLAMGNLTILPVFVLASVSHWLLDVVVHLPDLPVLGFDGDRKVGYGLWRWGRAAFIVELGLFLICAWAFVPASGLLWVLALGLAFHLVNANSFLGFNKSNPFASPNAYAGAALFGFGAMTVAFSLVL